MDGQIEAAVGSWVSIRDGELEESWRIATSHEADVEPHCISNQSPLGRALVGHRVGERVRVAAAEPRTVLILDIRQQSPA